RLTQDTHLQCQTATPPAQPDDDQDGGGGDDEGGSESGGSARQHGEFTAHSADTQGGESGDEQDCAGERETCTESMLKPGTGILAAELKLSSAGPVWEGVDT